MTVCCYSMLTYYADYCVARTRVDDTRQRHGKQRKCERLTVRGKGHGVVMRYHERRVMMSMFAS